MAKKKAASASKSKAAAGSAGKSSAKTGSHKASKSAKTKTKEKKPADNGKQAMSDEVIGHTAGAIWHTLSTGDGQSIAALKKSIDAPPELVLAAVGWLAREGKLDFNTSGRTLKVSLR